jgi:large subunit ribosomal protein L15
MINLSHLKPAAGSRHRKKLVGRGEGSGHGGSSTRGRKGQKSRSGDGVMTGFEGGQMPLTRRIPKRGFTSKFKKEFAVINVGALERCFEPNTEINGKILREKKLIKHDLPIKVLGDGEITKPLIIKLDACSGSAKEKIERAGGKVELPAARPVWKRAASKK